MENLKPLENPIIALKRDEKVYLIEWSWKKPRRPMTAPMTPSEYEKYFRETYTEDYVKKLPTFFGRIRERGHTLNIGDPLEKIIKGNREGEQGRELSLEELTDKIFSQVEEKKKEESAPKKKRKTSGKGSKLKPPHVAGDQDPIQENQ